MAKFEEQYDSENAICPYCFDSYQVEAEDYDEDEREEQCDECGMKYWLSQSFSVTHETRPDCELNGEDHVFERVKLYNGREADFCTVCDKCRSVTS